MKAECNHLKWSATIYSSVATEEIAFAMTLFVGAANGHTPAHSVAPEQPDEADGRRFFLDLAAPNPEAADALLESSLFHAFRVIWLDYQSDTRRASIAARVLGFCFLMERTRGAILQAAKIDALASETLIVLHPAVIEAVACVPLNASGVLTLAAFTTTLEDKILAHPDLQQGKAAAGLPTAVVSKVWPAGPSEVAELMRTRDWSAHSLGLPETWPQSLRTSVELTLASGFPMIVLWGPDLIQIYNDAYRNIMGVKHPAGLGQATAQCWPEVWSFNQPVYARVLQGESAHFRGSALSHPPIRFPRRCLLYPLL